MMWVVLALLHFMRKQIINSAGGEDQMCRWSFGQLLALATWIPSIIEWIYTYRCSWTMDLRLRDHID